MKIKTCKSALKRIKIKKNILQRKKAYKSHFLRKKNSNNLIRLSQKGIVGVSDFKPFLKLLKNF